MKKRMAKMGIKIARFAKNEAEKEVKALMTKHGINKAKAKSAMRKVLVYAIKSARMMETIVKTEAKKAMKQSKKKKK